MITVKLYGLLRLDSGIKERRIEAACVKEVFRILEAAGIPKSKLEGCVILVNGKSSHKRTKLTPGDTVQLLSPVAGG